VRDLDAHVLVEVRAITVTPFADLVGERAEREHVRLAEERDAVVEREPLAGSDLSRNRVLHGDASATADAWTTTGSRPARRTSVAISSSLSALSETIPCPLIFFCASSAI